jgi:hypothetical protein
MVYAPIHQYTFGIGQACGFLAFLPLKPFEAFGRVLVLLNERENDN